MGGIVNADFFDKNTDGIWVLLSIMRCFQRHIRMGNYGYIRSYRSFARLFCKCHTKTFDIGAFFAFTDRFF